MNLPRDPAVLKSIKDGMEEISRSMTRIEAEREQIKEAIKFICEEYELSKKTFRRLAKTYHKRNFSLEVAEHDEFETMYSALTGETVLKGDDL
jgi:tRNA(Ser,Leu) C12 N-acetylase TAN1